MKNSLYILSGIVVLCSLITSCELMAPEEVPIRPTSENSDLAHGSSGNSGGGILGGVLQQ